MPKKRGGGLFWGVPLFRTTALSTLMPRGRDTFVVISPLVTAMEVYLLLTEYHGD